MKWFQLDSDTPEDPKIRRVITELGNEGFGGLVRIWCHIANHGSKPGRSVTAAGVMSVDELRDASGLTPEMFLQLIHIATSSRHFDPVAWRKRKEIRIPAMSKRADTYTKKRLRETHGTKLEQDSDTVQTMFANKTVQDKTPQYRRSKSPEPDAPTARSGDPEVGVYPSEVERPAAAVGRLQAAASARGKTKATKRNTNGQHVTDVPEDVADIVAYALKLFDGIAPPDDWAVPVRAVCKVRGIEDAAFVARAVHVLDARVGR